MRIFLNEKEFHQEMAISADFQAKSLQAEARAYEVIGEMRMNKIYGELAAASFKRRDAYLDVVKMYDQG